MQNFKSTSLAEQLAQEYFGISSAAKVLPGHEDFNFRLKSSDGKIFILKISRPNSDVLNMEMQNAAMIHLAKQNIPLSLPQMIPNLNGETTTTLLDEKGKERTLRVLTWVEGRMFAHVNPKNNSLLKSLGQASGMLCKGLENFNHKGAFRTFQWDNSRVLWVKEHLDKFTNSEQRKIVNYFLQLFENQAIPNLSTLRKSVIHNDLNDLNIVVSGDLVNPKISGIIDFGDAVFTHTINDLAIACAYAIMEKPDPISAAQNVVAGFHESYALEEKEVEVLFPLIAARLLISVTHSAINKVNEPDNEYLFISEKPAWDLLEKLKAISPSFAHFSFRKACGWEACPKRLVFDKWMAEIREKSDTVFHPVIDLKNKKITPFDLSVGSLDLGHNQDFEDTPKFNKKVNQILEEKASEVGIGGYGEVRPVYTTDAYLVKGNSGPQWRTVHLGLDIWMEAGTPVCAPLDGIVHSFEDNEGDRNYGPTIILEHKISENFIFYTLYGHLSSESLDGLSEGIKVKKGQQIATIGDFPINGNWPPHLHFQVNLDMLGWRGDFPGVAFPDEQEVWLSLCPDPTSLFPSDSDIFKQYPRTTKSTNTKSKLLERRKKILGKNLSVSYQNPLHITRAYKQYLYASNGRRYLDTVNNVPHVGHQHPKIVRAAQRQTSVLNTNSRYLHETILEYAEALLATFPPELCVCYFVNSGSEANELAVRMAHTFSGQKEMIAMEVGYHGNTNAAVDLSSYKFDGKGGQGAPNYTHIVPIPDTYRGILRGNNSGKKYADYALNTIQKLASENKGIAGFIGEPILSCGGQVVPPNDYFKTVYKHIREAGGLCISDEVQVGFGRVGKHFWGFQLHDVIPDIVTMGKPIGNGHPLGAVVTTRAVAEAFDNGMEFFSTFGGNPVSCAIGKAVLEVIKEENLQHHALEIGEYLKNGLNKLKEKYRIVGDVRGHGLFLGFELIKDRKTLEPATKAASYLKNRMRELGILMSTDGPHENVLKIKPPMCFDKNNANFLLETLEEVLQEDPFLREI
jgi:4-aminobutyrate aminotransferase-like enzyme/Ser/Thr protein kinase RdoA (MazF antagonist)